MLVVMMVVVVVLIILGDVNSEGSCGGSGVDGTW